jgi:phosphatidylglycerol---prolipoprotein diacylglyceryl transferase
MYPELISIGKLTVHSYGLMMALAILVATLALYREAPREGINPDHLLEAIIVAAFFGLIGSRILYIILHWSYYSTQPFLKILTEFEGLTFYGAMFGGVIALLIWCSRRKISFMKMADLFAPYLALGYGFGRVGCFLNGCCYGKEADLPWALPINMADSVLRHPVQLYAALGGLLIFIILKLLKPRRPFIGFISLMLFALYGLLRFTTEFFRHGYEVTAGLTAAQIFSLALFVLSAAALALICYLLPSDKDSEKKKIKAEKK